MSKPLSATMVACVDAAREAGALVRYMGGFWVPPGTGWNGDRPDDEYFGGSTIQACVDRGALVYTQWKEGRAFRFPIEVKLPADPVGIDTNLVESK